MPFPIRCAVCGREWTIPDELLGKKVRCTCGEVLDVPKEPPLDDADLYTLADPLPETAGPGSVDGSVPPPADSAESRSAQESPIKPFRVGSPADMQELPQRNWAAGAGHRLWLHHDADQLVLSPVHRVLLLLLSGFGVLSGLGRRRPPAFARESLGRGMNRHLCRRGRLLDVPLGRDHSLRQHRGADQGARWTFAVHRRHRRSRHRHPRLAVSLGIAPTSQVDGIARTRGQIMEGNRGNRLLSFSKTPHRGHASLLESGGNAFGLHSLVSVRGAVRSESWR